jgi:uroporphyrinogen III methyltransferase/synthase
VVQPVAYRTLTPAGSVEKARKLLSHGKIDIATFTSSSTVQNLIDLLDGDSSPLKNVLIACIGPVTARKARELGLKVDVVARRHTVAGLVEALRDYVDSGSEA